MINLIYENIIKSDTFLALHHTFQRLFVCCMGTIHWRGTMTREHQFGNKLVTNHEYITRGNRGEDLLFVFFFFFWHLRPWDRGKNKRKMNKRSSPRLPSNNAHIQSKHNLGRNNQISSPKLVVPEAKNEIKIPIILKVALELFWD